jgi:hypothetical protein
VAVLASNKRGHYKPIFVLLSSLEREKGAGTAYHQKKKWHLRLKLCFVFQKHVDTMHTVCVCVFVFLCACTCVTCVVHFVCHLTLLVFRIFIFPSYNKIQYYS